MGTPKALLAFRGETFLDRLIRCLSSCCSPVIVVLGHEPEMIRAGVRSPGGAVFVLNPDYHLGQLSSMQCGLRAISDSAEGVIFTPVDHPNIDPSTVARLIQAHEGESGAPVVIPQMDGRHGHPVLITREIVAEILALPANSQARAAMHRHAGEIEYIDVADAGILDDVDDPQAYRRLLESA